MILKCNKTGQIFFNEDAAKAYADETDNKDFSEVAADQEMWISPEGRPFHTQQAVDQYKQRTRQPDLMVEKITIREFEQRLKQKEAEFLATKANDLRVIAYASKKILDTLIEVEGVSQLKAEKACWFTRNGSAKQAKAWLAEHANDPDLGVPLRLPPEHGPTPDDPSGGASSSGAAIDGGGEYTEEEKVGPNPESITKDLNQTMLQELVDMGFAKLRAEKALYFSSNAGIEQAVHWLTEHENDTDIDYPIRIAAVAPPKPKMSKEEAETKAYELQQRLKREREEREKQDAKDKEKARIMNVKLAQEAAIELEEANRKRAFEQIAREKEEHERHQAKLKEQLRLDYIERFGCEPPPESEKEVKIQDKSKKDQVIYWIGQMKKQYATTEPAKLKVCIETLKLYIGNLQKEPTNTKFHKIKKANKRFEEQVMVVAGAVELLDACGFKDKGGEFLEIEGTTGDGFTAGNAVKFLDLVLDKL